MKKFLCVLSLLFLMNVILQGYLSAQPEVDFYFGKGAFLNNVNVDGLINFENDPETAFSSGNPGGDGVSNYWDSFVYDGVRLSIVNWNSNVPGQRRRKDLGHPNDIELYNNRVNSGECLLPGLGLRLGGDHGVLIEFNDWQINAFGVNFGGILTTSQCCVVQLFSIKLSNGQVHDIRFSSANNYGGWGTDLPYSTFVGFYVKEVFIESVHIEQLGHTPILDNVMWGMIKPAVEPGVPHIVINARNFPENPLPASQMIELVDAEDNFIRKLIEEMKPNWREDIQTNRKVSKSARVGRNIAEVVLDSPYKEIAGHYLEGLEVYTDLSARILEKYERDPPRFDYNIISEYEINESTLGFVNLYGSGYNLLDETFLLWQYGLDILDLGYITLERLQGAIIDNDTNYITKQSEALLFFLSEGDYDLDAVAQNIDSIFSLLAHQGINDFLITDPSIEPITFYELNNFAAQTLSASRTIVNLRTEGPTELCGGQDVVLDYTISSPENLVCTASKSIQMVPGFAVEKGTSFHAYVFEPSPAANVADNHKGLVAPIVQLGRNNVQSVLSIYPNPVESELVIVCPSSINSYMAYIVITNSMGAVIRTKKVDILEPDSKIILPVADLPAGIYYVNVHIAEESYSVQKFVKL